MPEIARRIGIDGDVLTKWPRYLDASYLEKSRSRAATISKRRSGDADSTA